MSEHEFFQHLRKDHEKQKQLGDQLLAAKGPQDRERLRQAYRDELYPHMIGEEASLFDRLRAADDQEARDTGLEGLQEHHVLKMILRELMDLEPANDTFKAKAKVLDEINRHHMDEEEDEAFSHLKDLSSPEQLDRLFERYEQAEEKAEP